MIKAILFDLDGTVYIGKKPIPGAAEAIQAFKDSGIRVVYLTNRANLTVEQIVSRLQSMGIPADFHEVLTSSQAAAEYIEPKGRVYCIGEQGLLAPLEQAGFELTDNHPDYVIVGLDRGITYQKLEKACSFIRAGAKFYATNPDKFLTTENGIAPGTGALVAAVQTATQVAPIIIGKPERPIMDIAIRRLCIDPAHTILVGDNPETDIPSGLKVGLRTVLMLTGVVQSVSPDMTPKPTWTVTGYPELTDLVFREK